MADADDADPPRQGSPTSPVLWERLPRPHPANLAHDRESSEVFPPEMTELDLFWSGTGAADDFRPPPPRPTSASLPTSAPATAAAARDALERHRECVPERPPPEPPPPPWEPYPTAAARAAGELGACPEPASPVPTSAFEAAAAARAAFDRQSQHASRRPLPEPPPRPWELLPGIDGDAEDDDGRNPPASAEPSCPDRWPCPPPPLSDCADYERLFYEVEGQMRRGPGEAYSFQDFIADVGDDLFLLLADSPEPPGLAGDDPLEWRDPENDAEDECVYAHTLKRFTGEDHVRDEMDPLLSYLDEEDSSCAAAGSPACPVGLLMTYPLLPAPVSGRVSTYEYDEASESICVCSHPQQWVPPWPHPGRPSAPPWTSHLSHGSLFINRAFVFYKEEWTHLPPSPPQTTRPLLGAERYRFLVAHPDRKTGPPQDPALETRHLLRFGPQLSIAPPTSRDPHAPTAPLALTLPVDDARNLPTRDSQHSRRRAQDGDSPILRQVRARWREGTITKPTYTNFRNRADVHLRRHRDGSITESQLHDALLKLSRDIEDCARPRQRSRTARVRKRPAPSVWRPQRNNPFPVDCSAGCQRRWDNPTGRRRRRREHRLVVGGPRLRQCDGMMNWLAPAFALLDRKRAAKSVAAQASRMMPTTQRLRPSRRRRRKRHLRQFIR